ncbi:MAG: acyl-CoA thioesterase [Ilumatobacteraceae bacterium]
MSETIRTRWGEIDSNGHMRNVAYLDLASNSRMEFFNRHGYTLAEFFGAGIGPVVLRDEIDYRSEVRLAEELTIGHELAGMREDGSRFVLRTRFVKASGKVACTIASVIAFFDLATRKIVAPPDGLLQAILSLPRADDYAPLT